MSAAATLLEKPATEPAELSLRAKVFAFAAMSVGFFVALLDIQIVSASLGEIAGGLSAGPDEIAWVQTSYLIAEIVVIPLSGWLSRVMSTRWLFCVSAAGFTATSLLCGWAWDIQSMIVFRALQGFLGGSMIPTVFTTAFVYFAGQQRVIAAAVIGSISSLAPTLGPTIGGWITENYSWHWLFFINLVPGIFVAVVVPMLVRIDRPNLALLRGADYPGIALLALFLGCLEYTLEEGPRWDWFGDETIRATAWIAAITGLAFIWRSLTFANPVVDLRALKSRNFSLGCFFSFVTGIGIFSTIYLTPLFLGRVRGFSALERGRAARGLLQLGKHFTLALHLLARVRYQVHEKDTRDFKLAYGKLHSLSSESSGVALSRKCYQSRAHSGLWTRDLPEKPASLPQLRILISSQRRSRCLPPFPREVAVLGSILGPRDPLTRRTPSAAGAACFAFGETRNRGRA